MTGIKSTTDYLQVRGYIFLLSSIAPLSILHTILLVARPVLPEPFRTFYLPLAVQVWFVAEAVAYVFLYLPFKYYFLQLSASHPETLSREERDKLFVRCWATVSDPERYLSRWFRGAKKEDIKRDNVREWICWAFFNAHEVTEQEDEEVESYLNETERLLGRTLPPGKSKAKSIRLTLDAVDCSHRSLFWYFVSSFTLSLDDSLLILHACSVSRFSTPSRIL
jgi:Ca2+/Na+ antiporter